MVERSLFERLRKPGPKEEYRSADDPHEMEKSIVAHLRQMLNSRRGHSLIAPDYGLPDLTEVLRTYPSSLTVVEDSIRLSIERHEPRLTDVAVKLIESEDDILSLSFEIRARFAANRGLELRVRTETAEDGTFRLVS